ncbi:MAG: dTMP kinase [Alphaproteobacteria bacterium]|jgi:dTMP kinase|nr:dTMP kinase [Alphaproteobacteria bacterium]
MTTRGKFITLEGGDGAGKSTQIKEICAYLQGNGIQVFSTREVGGAPGAEAIRTLWLEKPQGYWDSMTELLLIMAARREHLVKTIWPKLEKGLWVISDRFVDSTRAYQGVGLELGVDVVDRLYHEIAGDFWPDMTLILDLPVDLGVERRNGRAGQSDRYESKEHDFHNVLRHAFLDLASKDEKRFRIIDASQNESTVSNAIKLLLQELN